MVRKAANAAGRQVECLKPSLQGTCSCALLRLLRVFAPRCVYVISLGRVRLVDTESRQAGSSGVSGSEIVFWVPTVATVAVFNSEGMDGAGWYVVGR